MGHVDRVHRVGIVVSKEISGEQLESNIHTMHTWVVSCEESEEVAKKYWEGMSPSIEDPYSEGITIFNVDEEITNEEVVDYIIDTVAEHHNEPAHIPAWSEVHIWGCQLTDALKKLFIEFGFVRYEVSDASSFVAKKAAPL